MDACAIRSGLCLAAVALCVGAPTPARAQFNVVDGGALISQDWNYRLVTSLGATQAGSIPDGAIYTVDAQERLLNNVYANGDWQVRDEQIGVGWQSFTRLAGGIDGTLLAINGTGDVLWYKHLGQGQWGAGTGTVIDSWPQYKHVFRGAGDEFIAIDDDDGLYWYQYGEDLQPVPDSGSQIGSGWGGFVAVGSGGYPGDILAATADGKLLWYRYRHAEGGWTATAPVEITTHGGDWKQYSQFLGGNSGHFFALTPAGKLDTYHYTDIGDCAAPVAEQRQAIREHEQDMADLVAAYQKPYPDAATQEEHAANTEYEQHVTRTKQQHTSVLHHMKTAMDEAISACLSQ